MTLKPLFDRVVVKDAESEETTKSGIILTKLANIMGNMECVACKTIAFRQSNSYIACSEITSTPVCYNIF